MTEKENLEQAGKTKKIGLPKLILLIAVFIFGLFQIAQGVQQLNASGLPDKQELASAAEKSLSEMKDFKEPGAKMQMSYPASWELEEAKDPMVFKARLFKKCVNLIVTKDKGEPAGTTAAQYLAAVDEQVSKSNPGLKMTKVSEAPIDLNGIPAIKRVQLTHQLSDGKDLVGKQVCVICLKDNDAYTFNFTALEDFFPAFEPVINKVIGSIKFAG